MFNPLKIRYDVFYKTFFYTKQGLSHQLTARSGSTRLYHSLVFPTRGVAAHTLTHWYCGTGSGGLQIIST